ncbi:MAG: flagellar basal body P-ring protein FlgI [Sulfurimonas sp.]|uniref:flagellar basal body P-ring protein FlgI n=1 Tax=Sulfurimonas sp. TaxID=2022749 RepID=UPI002613B07D|nr:flagellar basal body P-ring protein FlgI [Sulfurimonas sp.]MCW8896322.1 flagellar basal body P-ring protein FlgI [Sulfurimonas sp.]MCW8953883.1 flagellar basal body P-ring protein FlgI [Sulfurimonas sp.]MCW9068120.1 flagellar basal body P-ring protein FlgI [Sulfurimonas sp.]
MRKFILLLLISTTIYAAKISNVANIVGVRDNHLIGYSLVVGLKKTGDGTTSKFTLQSIANMLKAMNIDMKPVDIKSKNVAAVVVTAELAPFSKQGDKFNITVSSIGDAKSLEGGTLLMTPLKGVDGKIYALAQGAVSIGGRNGGGGAESHPTAGLIYNGGVVEREININLYNQEFATLSLKEANFKNSVSVQKSINDFYNTQTAVAMDSRTVKLKKPKNRSMIEFLAEVQDIEMTYDVKDRIIINERTGTIISGVGIKIKPIIMTHGDITIKITEQNELSKPKGSMQVDDDMVIGLYENELYTKKGTTTVANLVRSLQKMGAQPKDIISILEAMKSAGSISAELKVI